MDKLRVTEAFGGIGSQASPSKEMKTMGEYLVDGLVAGIGNIWKTVSTKFTNFWESIKTWFTNKKEAFQNRGKAIVSNINSGIGTIWKSISGKFTTFAKDVKDWFGNSKIVQGFKNRGKSLVTNISSGIGNIWNTVKSKFTSFWTSMYNWFSGKSLKLQVTWDTSSKLGKALEKMGLNGFPKLSFYASGGFPQVGELFVARERGAEMVGSINNRPAVANNQQIVEGIEGAVYRAMMSAAQRDNNIILNVTVPLDKAVLGKASVDYHNGYVKSTGRSPLLIGG